MRFTSKTSSRLWVCIVLIVMASASNLSGRSTVMTTSVGITGLSTEFVYHTPLSYISIHSTLEHLRSLEAVECHIKVDDNELIRRYIPTSRFSTTVVVVTTDSTTDNVSSARPSMCVVVPVQIMIGDDTNWSSFVVSVEIISVLSKRTSAWVDVCFHSPWNTTWSYMHSTCYPSTTSIWNTSNSRVSLSSTDTQKASGDVETGNNEDDTTPKRLTLTGSTDFSLVVIIGVVSLVCGACMISCRKVKDKQVRDCQMKEQEALGEFPPLEIVDPVYM
jgi:hypothetical protein